MISNSNALILNNFIIIIIIIIIHSVYKTPQLPEDFICCHNTFNYTLIIDSETGNNFSQTGPISCIDSVAARKTIIILSSNLKVNERYSLRITMGTHQQTVTSNKHYFSKLSNLYIE